MILEIFFIFTVTVASYRRPVYIVCVFSNCLIKSVISCVMCVIIYYHYRILIAVASIRSTYQFDNEDTNLHQMMILKVNSLPFGIYVYGTRKMITFDFIAALVSILGSMFLFIIGANATNST
jgi:hypothetical protein